MSTESRIEVLESQVQHLRKELERASELVEYYRQFAPELGQITVPAPGFFVHQRDMDYLAGRLTDGSLEVLADFPDHHQAVAHTWEIYHALIQDKTPKKRK